ncbi:MAG: hypothetical protein IPJ97_10500 [Proteobacteria bacterium]|nr:hypothetical protein [Pseudomonadota bacterium]
MSRRPDILDATEHLSRFIAQEAWAMLRIAHLELLFEPILQERGSTLDDVLRRITAAGHFAPLIAFVDEDFVTMRVGPEGDRAIDAYLRRRGWQETPRAREYLQAMGKSSPTLYEVQAVSPGEWIEVRDRLVDEPQTVRVDEQSGSRSLQRYDCFIGRVVQARGEKMLAAGTLTLTRIMAERVDAALRRNESQGDETTAAVCLREWLRGLLEAGERPMPTLQTTDGEPLLISRTRLPLARTARAATEVARKLDAAADTGWRRDEPGVPAWTWLREPAGVPSTVLARVRLETDTLVLETLSHKRAEAALAALQTILGKLVGRGLTVHEDPVQSLAQGKPRKRNSGPPEPSSEEAAAMASAMAQFKQQHYRRTLDEKCRCSAIAHPANAHERNKGASNWSAG